ncbi:hypothetical protein KIN20_003891 [Parelaphostrongylus tenuis]|uniref:Uncharacterized protein n=1 Tax=Parelaphostrongylus tenuis TaxID=148309 RepID=A0AAD5LZU4_PARTN|nr:hypothetical protein KIN20_003891 [Parelaphostrongylus tenuis]
MRHGFLPFSEHDLGGSSSFVYQHLRNAGTHPYRESTQLSLSTLQSSQVRANPLRICHILKRDEVVIRLLESLTDPVATSD